MTVCRKTAVKCAESFIERRHAIAVADVSANFCFCFVEKIRSRAVEGVSGRRIFQSQIRVRRVVQTEIGIFQIKKLCAKTARELQFIVEKLQQILRVNRVARLICAGEKIAETVGRKTVVAVFFVFKFVTDGDFVKAVRRPIKMPVRRLDRAVENTC